MAANQNFLNQLLHLAQSNHHRFGVVLKGETNWQHQLCQLAAQQCSGSIFQLGGEALPYVEQWRAINKGQQLLGYECSLLLIDLSYGFDANSVNAILGTLKGGGIAIFFHAECLEDDLATRWLVGALNELLVIEQNQALPALPEQSHIEADFAPFAMQQQAVELIKKVVTGSRRRPLVLTADRGRGKTTALGIASAELMQSRSIRIVVTSPTVGNVAPLFHHAEMRLSACTRSKLKLEWQNSSIEFVAPDEVVEGELQCDLLLVDEASAIPLPMLKRMVEKYHRAVFSTTIHGYEGCGRGFSLKFQSWLAAERSGTRFYHMDTPIRWRENDPLEAWQYRTFLLDAELDECPYDREHAIVVTPISQQVLLSSPDLLKQCFALLVNAHYQTTPNDLLLLLSDPAMKLFTVLVQGKCIACVVGVEEGGMDEELAQQVLLGKRRPKGHLVASSLATQLAAVEPAKQLSLRVMRIAVHPAWQGQGVGSTVLRQLTENGHYGYYSTSFGVTAELYRFWYQNGYRAVKLGSQRDQASGCYSVIMVDTDLEWKSEAEQLFAKTLVYQLKNLYQQLDVELVCCLVNRLGVSKESVHDFEKRLLTHYSLGGSSYDNVVAVLERFTLQYAMSMPFALLIRKVVQQHSWQACSKEFSLAGRKQTETELRHQASLLLSLLE